MSDRTRTIVPITVVTVAILIANVLVSSRTAESYPNNAQNEIPKWDYKTESLETGALEAELTELGIEGWEVFSIERTDGVDTARSGALSFVHSRVQAREPGAALPTHPGALASLGKGRSGAEA